MSAAPVTAHDDRRPAGSAASAFLATDGGGDPSATSADDVESAFLRHAPALLRYLYVRTRRIQDAEDLLVDTFIHARRYGKPILQPGAWLYTVARRCANRFLDHRRRETTVAPTDEQGALSLGDSASHGGAFDPRAPEIVALLALTQGDREILLAHGLDECPIAEVAVLLGIAEDAAWQRWQRARNRYFDHLMAVGVRPSESWRRPRRGDRAAGAVGEVAAISPSVAVVPPAASSADEEEGLRHEL